MRALVAFLFTCSLAAQAPLAERLQQCLQSHLGELAPGAQAAVVRPDGTLVAFHCGVADRATRAPMTDDGKLLAGSVGKTFFAALAVQLANEGKLDLDGRLATWLGREPWFAKLPNGDATTLRHLLQHRSGLPRYEFDPKFTEQLLARPDHCFTPAEELAFVFTAKPRFAAGEGFEYADTNYVLLGLVLEQVAGKPCYAEIQRRFLEPLRLLATVPSVGRSIPGLLQGHAGADNPFGGRDAMLQDGKLPFDAGFEGAGGGFASTASDLARWARALWGGDVLGTRLAEVLDAKPAPLGRGSRYGLGVIVDPTAHGPAHGHRGFFPGYQAEVRWYPDAKVAVAILVNSSAERRLSRALQEAADACTGLARAN
ncbi:MAG: beta-lactamase family protein [Planctomycetes bacterium]|nr:beta-lactamase family protein [Planctomycetota bacterium]